MLLPLIVLFAAIFIFVAVFFIAFSFYKDFNEFEKKLFTGTKLGKPYEEDRFTSVVTIVELSRNNDGELYVRYRYDIDGSYEIKPSSYIYENFKIIDGECY